MDIKTLIIVTGILFIAQFVVLLTQYIINKKYPGVKEWLVGSSLISIGFFSLLFALVPHLKYLGILGNPLIALGHIFLSVGILNFLERKIYKRFYILLYLVMISGFLYFLFVKNDISYRTEIVSLSLSIILFITAYNLYFNKDKYLAISANFTATVFLGDGIFLLYRTYSTFMSPSIKDYLNQPIIQTTAFLMLMLASTLWTFGFIIMVNQKLNAENIETRDNLELIFNTNPYAVFITRMSDGEIISINDEFSNLTKFASNEIVGKIFTELEIWNNADDAKKIQELQNKLKFFKNLEVYLTRKDQSIFTGLVSGNIIHMQGEYHVINVINDISEQKKFETELKKAKEDAEAAGAIKEVFLTNMSHEIRTPLNGIYGMTQLMKFTEMDIQQLEYINIIDSQSKLLMQLLNNILDYSKLKYGKTMLIEEQIDLRELVKELKVFLAVGIKSGVEIIFNVEESVPDIILGDKVKLQEILINLLGNAVKFTKSGVVSLLVENNISENINNVKFTVRDTGIGISKKSINLLFSNFTQADDTISRKYGGTGLGLAISKELVELMGGEISVESVENEGTKFSFSIHPKIVKEHIPRKIEKEIIIISQNSQFAKIFHSLFSGFGISKIFKYENLDEAIEKNRNSKFGTKIFITKDYIEENKAKFDLVSKDIKDIKDIIVIKKIEEDKDADIETYINLPIEQEEIYSILEKDLNENYEEKTNEETLFELNKEKAIMVVEDSKTNIEVYKEMFKIFKIEAEFYSSGIAAVESLKKNRYDIVLTDVQLPDMDGFEILKKIREFDKNEKKHTHVIAVTAHALEEYREKCINAGMDDYIEKPIKMNDLNRLLYKYMKITLPNGRIINSNRELEIIRKVAPIAYRDAKKLVSNIFELIKSEEYTEIEKIAHKLQGSFSNIRRSDIEEAAVKINEFAKNNNGQSILPFLDYIQKEVEKFENISY